MSDNARQADIRRRFEENAVAHMPHETPAERFARELLDRARAALAGVTDGPWSLQRESCDCGNGYGCSHEDWPYSIHGPVNLPVTESGIQGAGGSYQRDYGHQISEIGDLSWPDAEFIAASRTLVPELTAELERSLALVAEFRRRDVSADRVIARLKAENAGLNEYVGDLDREIDWPLTAETEDARRRIRSASDPVQAFDAFVEKWVSPRWHAHLAHNDDNDATYIRAVIRGSQR